MIRGWPSIALGSGTKTEACRRSPHCRDCAEVRLCTEHTDNITDMGFTDDSDLGKLTGDEGGVPDGFMVGSGRAYDSESQRSQCTVSRDSCLNKVGGARWCFAGFMPLPVELCKNQELHLPVPACATIIA